MKNSQIPFKLVFLTVLSLTLLSGGTSLWLASKNDISDHQARAFEGTTTTWQTGVGAIFGLLGGRVQPEEE